MKRFLFQPLIKGAMVVLPLLVTVWFLWSASIWLNQLGLDALNALNIPNLFPGLGLVLMVSVLLVVGILFQLNPVNWLYQYFEDLVLRFPVIKTLYGAVKDFAGMFDQKEQHNQQVVLVKVGELGQAVGFITSNQMPEAVKESQPVDDLVCVYFPMSYMVGGYTLFVPKADLTPVDWSFEDAMRFALTAGVSQTQARHKHLNQK